MDKIVYHLKIKTQKVQSFIFKVPKLKAMLGANSLLGEFFAKDLPQIREKYSILADWNNHVDGLDLKAYCWEIDDLKSNFKKGVICSAGGHFETLFATEEEAEAFVRKVRLKANEKIPGIQLSFFLRKIVDFNHRMTYEKFDKIISGKIIPLNDGTTQIHVDSPYFYPSAEDGENPQLIEGHIREPDNANLENDSEITKRIKDQGQIFYSGKSDDFLCCFLKNIIQPFVQDKKEGYKDVFPSDLPSLAALSLVPDNNKIGIIAIDGNAMGNRFKNVCETNKTKPVFEAMVEFEKFWYEQRETFRNALEKTLNNIDLQVYFEDEKDRLPYQVLMLGGDDLLMVTVPEIAISFTINFGKEITNINKDLSVAAGVAFVKSSYPFSHAHELAESLLSSAKVKSRIWQKEVSGGNQKDIIRTTYRNAMDWHIHFPTGTLDIDSIRRQNYFLEYNDNREILTQRPCTLEQAEAVWNDSIGLHKSIQQIEDNQDENITGRNKYKQFRSLLKTGEKNVKLYSKVLKINNKYAEYIEIGSPFSGMDKKMKLNTALDVIELMDFHNRKI